MPPAIIAAAVAVGATAAATAGYIAMSTALYISIAASVAGTLLSKPSIPSLSSGTTQQERKQVLRAAAAAQTIIYGRTVTSGVLFFAEEQAGAQDDGEWLHLAIALCGHPIDGVEQIWLGDDRIETFTSNNVTYEVHSGRTTPDPFMLQNCPSWKNDMIGMGITWLRMSLKFDAELFPAGLPNIKVQLRGKQVTDPRTGEFKWTQNAALIIRDYLQFVCGVIADDTDEASFIQGANISDEQVATAVGSEARYSINGEMDVSDSRSQTLDDMCLACAGEMTYIAGKHGLLVGAYYGPATMELTDDQIIDNIDIVPETAYADKVNTVTGVFVDPGQGYVEADFPPVSVAEYIEQDGAVFSEDLKLKFVTSEYQAQRLAQIKINRKRLGRTINIKTNMFGYRYRPGYYVNLSVSMLGIARQEMRVTSWKLDPKGGVAVTVRQETPDVWLDAVGVPLDRPDLSNLPSSAVAAPYNLAYEVEEIGEVVQGTLKWQNAGEVTYNKVIIRQNGSVVMTAQVPGQSVRLSGLLRGDYTAGVIAVSAMGGQSPEAFLSFSIAAPAAPTGIDVQQSYFSITLIPRTSDANAATINYDFWWSGETELTDLSTANIEAQATRLGLGKVWTQNELKADHTYHFYVRAMNAFGTSNFVKASVMCKFSGADFIDYIDEGIRKSEAFQSVIRDADATYEAIMENALAGESEYLRKSIEVNAVDVKLSASITTVSNIVVNDRMAYAEQFTQLNAAVNSSSATVQTLASSYADLNGKLSAQWGAKVQVASNGLKYVAGIQLGVEGNGGDIQSYFLVTADTFGFYNTSNGGIDLAFAITNGQTYIREAMIPYASITLARLGSFYSSNYVAGQSGTIMRSDGSFEFYGNPGSGRFVLDGRGCAWYDSSGQLVAAMGAQR